jgi:hypothetical protein
MTFGPEPVDLRVELGSASVAVVGKGRVVLDGQACHVGEARIVAHSRGNVLIGQSLDRGGGPVTRP